jgi:hypothetical protein
MKTMEMSMIEKKPKRTHKQSALKALAALAAESMRDPSPAKWQDAGKLAQMGAVVARVGDVARVADFDPEQNGANAWGAVNMAMPIPMMHGGRRIGGDMGDLDRNQMLAQGAIMAGGADAIKSMAAHFEAKELAILTRMRGRVIGAQKKTIDTRIEKLINNMEMRNNGNESKDDRGTGPLAPPQLARGHQAGEGEQAVHAPNGVRRIGR